MNNPHDRNGQHRDPRGRFTKGCNPGPGRPRKKRKPKAPTIGGEQLWFIARQLEQREEMLEFIRENYSTEIYALLFELVKRADAFDLGDDEEPTSEVGFPR